MKKIESSPYAETYHAQRAFLCGRGSLSLVKFSFALQNAVPRSARKATRQSFGQLINGHTERFASTIRRVDAGRLVHDFYINAKLHRTSALPIGGVHRHAYNAKRQLLERALDIVYKETSAKTSDRRMQLVLAVGRGDIELTMRYLLHGNCDTDPVVYALALREAVRAKSEMVCMALIEFAPTGFLAHDDCVVAVLAAASPNRRILMSLLANSEIDVTRVGTSCALVSICEGLPGNALITMTCKDWAGRQQQGVPCVAHALCGLDLPHSESSLLAEALARTSRGASVRWAVQASFAALKIFKRFDEDTKRAGRHYAQQLVKAGRSCAL